MPRIRKKKAAIDLENQYERIRVLAYQLSRLNRRFNTRVNTPSDKNRVLRARKIRDRYIANMRKNAGRNFSYDHQYSSGVYNPRRVPYNPRPRVYANAVSNRMYNIAKGTIDG